MLSADRYRKNFVFVKKARTDRFFQENLYWWKAPECRPTPNLFKIYTLACLCLQLYLYLCALFLKKMTENRGYMQRYAMLFGTYLGGFWILKFILFPLGLSIPFLLFLFMGLTLCVPFMGYHYTRMYRNQVCGGSISFLHAWIFTVFMYMFAALLAAVAHYIYFQFIDHGYVLNAYETQLNTLAHSNIPGMEEYVDTYREALDLARMSTPIDITLQLVSWNVFCGSLLALPTALFVMRRKRPESNEMEAK